MASRIRMLSPFFKAAPSEAVIFQTFPAVPLVTGVPSAAVFSERLLSALLPAASDPAAAAFRLFLRLPLRLLKYLSFLLQLHIQFHSL